MSSKLPAPERARVEKDTKLKALQVIDSELSSLKQGRKVYKKQPNSNIFFREDINQVMAHAKKELEELIQSYKDAEKTQEETE